VTLPEHYKDHHLHRECQDLFQHQWQEGEIHFQEQDIAISCASTDAVHLREHDCEKEEQEQEEEQVATSGDSQDGQLSSHRVQPPPSVPIPQQMRRSRCTNNQVQNQSENLPQDLLRHWVERQHNVQGKRMNFYSVKNHCT
jgi:hypothetical protein